MIKRDYNYRRKCKLKEKDSHYALYNYYCCRPRSPKIQLNEFGVEYIVEGTKDNRKKGLKRRSSKIVRKRKYIKNGGAYRKEFPLLYEWY